MNTKRRQQTTRINLINLMNNSVYGETTKNLINRVDEQLVHTKNTPYFRTMPDLIEHLVGIQCKIKNC